MMRRFAQLLCSNSFARIPSAIKRLHSWCSLRMPASNPHIGLEVGRPHLILQAKQAGDDADLPDVLKRMSQAEMYQAPAFVPAHIVVKQIRSLWCGQPLVNEDHAQAF